MSLINQMLKDLEKRNRESVPPEITLSGLFSTDTIQEHDKKINLLFIPLLLVFTLIFVSAYLYKDHNRVSSVSAHKTKADQIATVHANKLALSAPSSMQIPTFAQALLTGITLRTQQNVTSLDFLLNQTIYYSVETDNRKNTLTIHLEDTNLISELSPIDYVGSAIKGMEITNDSHGGLAVTLALNDDVELQHLDLVGQSNNSGELQIDLIAKKIPDAASSANLNNASTDKVSIKKPVDQFNAEQQYKNALNIASLGEYNRSIQILTGLLEQYPDFTLARETLITFLMQHGHVTKAKQILTASLDEHPSYLPYIQLKAQILISEGKLNRALDLLERAAPPIDKDPKYHAMIAALYQNTGQPQLSAKRYEQLIKLQPNKGIWWMGLAIALESIGNTSQAKEAYIQANNSSGLTPELTTFIQTRINNI
jgi:tetratricopeptide (TPR) repeat protein